MRDLVIELPSAEAEVGTPMTNEPRTPHEAFGPMTCCVGRQSRAKDSRWLASAPPQSSAEHPGRRLVRKAGLETPVSCDELAEDSLPP